MPFYKKVSYFLATNTAITILHTCSSTRRQKELLVGTSP